MLPGAADVRVFGQRQVSMRINLDRLRPGFSVVRRSGQHAPPRGRAGADFVKQQERSAFGLEQDRVPGRESVGGEPDAIAGFSGSGPFPIFQTRNVNAHVGISFFSATEPRGDQAGFGFGNGRVPAELREWFFKQIPDAEVMQALDELKDDGGLELSEFLDLNQLEQVVAGEQIERQS